MLLTKELEVPIVSGNVKYYEKLGYTIPRTMNNKNKMVLQKDAKITIDIKDLPPKSRFSICFRCDICGKDADRKYCDYTISHGQNKKLTIDACEECQGEKTKIRNKSVDLNKSEIGYWSNKNNLILEFNKYYDKYQSFAGMNKNSEGISIINALQKHNESITSMALELGYSIDDFGKIPVGWYDDFDVLKTDILILANKLQRFPTISEIQKDLRIGNSTILKHGGMKEIHRLIDYDQETNLLDDNNYLNASSYEYIVAQFLIHNTNITYERNVIISPTHGKFNCDFRATIDQDVIDNNFLWIEVWGGYGVSKFKGEYDKTHDIKMKIYNELNYSLISLYPSDFDGKSFEEIQAILYSKLAKYIDLQYKAVDNQKFSSYKIKTDQDILDELMTYSDDGHYLPLESTIQKVNSSLYTEVRKRFSNFGSMAEKFNLIDRLKSKPNGYWTEDKILSSLDKIHEKYGLFLSRTEMEINRDVCDFCNEALLSTHRVCNIGGILLLQLKCLNNKIDKLSNYDLLFLKKVAYEHIKNIPPTQQQLAKEILFKYNQQQAI